MYLWTHSIVIPMLTYVMALSWECFFHQTVLKWLKDQSNDSEWAKIVGPAILATIFTGIWWYQVRKDPDCLENLIDYPNQEKTRVQLQQRLEDWMVKTGDPILECFQKRDEPEFVEAYVQKLEAEANARRKSERTKTKPNPKKN